MRRSGFGAHGLSPFQGWLAWGWGSRGCALATLALAPGYLLTPLRGSRLACGRHTRSAGCVARRGSSYALGRVRRGSRASGVVVCAWPCASGVVVRAWPRVAGRRTRAGPRLAGRRTRWATRVVGRRTRLAACASRRAYFAVSVFHTRWRFAVVATIDPNSQMNNRAAAVCSAGGAARR